MLPLETFKDEYVLAVNSGIQCSLPFLSWSGFFGCPQASPILLAELLTLYFAVVLCLIASWRACFAVAAQCH